MPNSGEYKSLKQLQALSGTDVAINLLHQLEENN